MLVAFVREFLAPKLTTGQNEAYRIVTKKHYAQAIGAAQNPAPQPLAGGCRNSRNVKGETEELVNFEALQRVATPCEEPNKILGVFGLEIQV